MDKDSETDSDRNSVYSNWSKTLPINKEINNIPVNTADKSGESQIRKKVVKNIALVPYKPKPNDWGSWKVKSPYATSTIASPSINNNKRNQNNNEEMVYVPHSLYYSPSSPTDIL